VHHSDRGCEEHAVSLAPDLHIALDQRVGEDVLAD